MDIPGFRFYPTEEELLGFYLKKRIQACHPQIFDKIIPTLDLYQYDPWELPGALNSLLLPLFEFKIKIFRQYSLIYCRFGSRCWGTTMVLLRSKIS